MRLFIVTNQPIPNGMAATRRVKCLAKAAFSGGIDCEIIITTRTERYGIKPNNIEGNGVVDGIPFHYMGGTPLRHFNPLIRRYFDWSDHCATKRYLSTHLQPNDVVLFYCEKDISLVNSLSQIAHLHGAKIIRDLCELPFGTSKETPTHIANRRKVLQTQFPLMDGIICISDTLVELAKRHTSPSCKIIKIPILVDFTEYDLPDLYSENDPPYIFHAGTLTDQKDGITGMIEGFALARRKWHGTLHFYLTGYLEKSPQRRAIEEIISKYQLENDVIFLGYLSDKELRDYLCKAAMVIINKLPTQQNHYCFSTKMAEYLAASKPLIITQVGEAMNWVKDHETAIVIKPSAPTLLAEAITTLLVDSALRHKIGTNGKRLCKNYFNCTKYSQLLSDFCKNL